MEALTPTTACTVAALRAVGRELGAACAFHHEGSFYFEVSDRWTLAVTPDAGDRFCLRACLGTTEVGKLWCKSGDRRRLADLAQSIRAEVTALSA